MEKQDLIINKFGARLRKIRQRFQIFHPPTNFKKEYPAKEVAKIVILRPCSVSSGAVELATENDVDIVYLGKYGRPYARIYPSKLGGTVLIRKRQAEISHSKEATTLAKQFVLGKCYNQINYLKYLSKTGNQDFSQAIDKSEAILESLRLIKGNIKDTRDQLLGIEGYVADKYFSTLSKIISFPGRQPQKPKDPFNNMLNYGYGILKAEVERACVMSGLDPYTGFYHTERYGKPALVLDLTEEFRVPLVDSAIVPLFTEQKVEKEDLETKGNGIEQLSKTGRVKVINAVFQRFYQKIIFGKKRWELIKIIELQTRNLAGFLVGKRENYFSLKFGGF